MFSLLKAFGYLLLAFVLYFLVFFDILVKGHGTLVRGFDSSVQSFAWLSKVTRGWRLLEPPLWDFTSFSGTNFIGEFQTGVLYPGNILLAWLTSTLTQHDLDVYLYIHYCFAFFSMAIFLHFQRLGIVPVLLGAYAFASYLDWLGFISILFSAPQWLLALDHLSRSYRWAPKRTFGLERIPYEVYGFTDVIDPAMLDYLSQGWFPWVPPFALVALSLSSGRARRLHLLWPRSGFVLFPWFTGGTGY